MGYPIKLSVYLKDIRFWILFFFVIRMYGITFPPLEVGHNWRQTDGMMVARNFYEQDANIFFPRVDVAGEKTGIVGCEFPLLNYLVYLMSAAFGFEHWYGRLIVLITSCFGVFYFHRTIKRWVGEQQAFYGAIILLTSMWFSYSRKNIPDVFSVSLCIAALFYALRYLDQGRFRDIVLFFTLALAGCLTKILAATVLTSLAIPILARHIPLSRKVWLTCFSAVILAAVCAWYFFWVPYLNTTYGLADHFFMGMTFGEGAHAIMAALPDVLKRFYDTPLKYTGFAVFLWALYTTVRKKAWTELAVFLLPFMSFIILLFKTGASIVGDTYYILTVIPAMAFIIGCALARIPDVRITYILLLAIGIENISSQVYSFRIRQPYKSLADLETILDGFSQRTDRIAINSEKDNPTAMYFAHRKGWTTYNQNLADPAYREEIKSKGCKYIVIVRQLYGDMDLDYPRLYESEYFKIYKIQ